ncbi:hypothetical protein CRG98_025171 [Punica granatum]|uniref:Protein kinase domain-containing protein n=1 Tax=Punica granatum TaxID=22663 RepID=A0A2I0JDR5_PUNGR|nr:hypothetical protein CRG98_025171 [Punica granatum]
MGFRYFLPNLALSQAPDSATTLPLRCCAGPPHCHHCHPRDFNLLKNMVWDLLGLSSCFLPTSSTSSSSSPSSSRNQKKAHGRGLKKQSLEQNKAWLLAESGGPELTGVEPQSVHSSFRFSFCSQVELETTMNNNIGPSNDDDDDNNNNAAAAILMVNLHNALDLEEDQSSAREQRCRVLGRGALSCVYRGRVGVLRTAVAIKRLEREDKESPKAFCRELVIASSLHHPNVAPLVGFCMDSEEGFFLVYKYVSGGSLELHLQGDRTKEKKRCPTLAWSMRYKVAVGVSEAIAYLHNGTGRCVVHRDIKPSNILLSSKKKPKLCDFGLASWTPVPSVPFLCKTVKGTFGYLAPEYFQHGKVYDKTDVYALGVVLLELITGRKPIEPKRPPGEENLVTWAKPLLHKGIGGVEKLLDPRIENASRSSTQIVRMIEAAAACINSEESRRPHMREVVAILRGEEEPISSTNKKKTSFPSNGHVMDSAQLQQTKREMSSHLALAMLGVEDDDYFYWN